MKRIFIIRHGQTVLNKRKALQGRSDQPLDETGIRQAEKARQIFSEKNIIFDRVYSSPLQRAVKTAQIIAGTDSILTDERLTEMDYGPYEGTDLTNPPPEIIRFFRDFVHAPAPEGMEQLFSVTARMGSFLEEMKHTEGTSILVSTHAIAMKGALEYLSPQSRGQWWSRYIGNCDVYVTELKDGVYSEPEKLL